MEVENEQSVKDNWRDKSISSSEAVIISLKIFGISEPPAPGGASLWEAIKSTVLIVRKQPNRSN